MRTCGARHPSGGEELRSVVMREHDHRLPAHGASPSRPRPKLTPRKLFNAVR